MSVDDDEEAFEVFDDDMPQHGKMHELLWFFELTCMPGIWEDVWKFSSICVQWYTCQTPRNITGSGTPIIGIKHCVKCIDTLRHGSELFVHYYTLCKIYFICFLVSIVIK